MIWSDRPIRKSHVFAVTMLPLRKGRNFFLAEVSLVGTPELTLISSRRKLTYKEAEDLLRSTRGGVINSTKWSNDIAWQLGKRNCSHSIPPFLYNSLCSPFFMINVH